VLYPLLTGLVVLADQASKILIERYFLMQRQVVVDPLLTITYAQNYGAAFGIMPDQTVLLIGITITVLVGAWLGRRKIAAYPRLFKIGLALALGGAVGNLIDRVRLGYVIDFIQVPFWPIFNLADSAIALGVGLLLWGAFRQNLNPGPPEKPDSLQEEDHATDSL
jgi:signal peptidase II